jgi:RimJ/RimL family protein N-acetyltransferase
MSEWIANTGTAPVDDDVIIDVVLRNGDKYDCTKANGWEWDLHKYGVFSIQAWRPHVAVVAPTYTIKHYDNIGHSPAWPLVPSYLGELEASGLGENPRQGPAYNDPAFVHFSNGKPVGFLSYRYDDVRCGYWILAAWTASHSRKTGVHTRLFEALVRRAKVKDVCTIISGTHVDNAASQAAFKKQGRTATHIMYEYRINDYVDGMDA